MKQSKKKIRYIYKVVKKEGEGFFSVWAEGRYKAQYFLGVSHVVNGSSNGAYFFKTRRKAEDYLLLMSKNRNRFLTILRAIPEGREKKEVVYEACGTGFHKNLESYYSLCRDWNEERILKDEWPGAILFSHFKIINEVKI